MVSLKRPFPLNARVQPTLPLYNAANCPCKQLLRVAISFPSAVCSGTAGGGDVGAPQGTHCPPGPEPGGPELRGLTAGPGRARSPLPPLAERVQGAPSDGQEGGGAPAGLRADRAALGPAALPPSSSPHRAAPAGRGLRSPGPRSPGRRRFPLRTWRVQSGLGRGAPSG